MICSFTDSVEKADEKDLRLEEAVERRPDVPQTPPEVVEIFRREELAICNKLTDVPPTPIRSGQNL